MEGWQDDPRRTGRMARQAAREAAKVRVIEDGGEGASRRGRPRPQHPEAWSWVNWTAALVAGVALLGFFDKTAQMPAVLASVGAVIGGGLAGQYAKSLAELCIVGLVAWIAVSASLGAHGLQADPVPNPQPAAVLSASAAGPGNGTLAAPGRRYQIGVGLLPKAPFTFDRQTIRDGVEVAAMDAASPAAKAGLVPGDVVVSIDGKPLHGPRGLAASVERHEGTPLTLGVIRGDELLFKTVVPAEGLIVQR